MNTADVIINSRGGSVTAGVQRFARSRYPSHSHGRRYFLAELHFLHAGTEFPFDAFPPLIIGTTWSMVRSPGG
jgi:hypothetical protein